MCTPATQIADLPPPPPAPPPARTHIPTPTQAGEKAHYTAPDAASEEIAQKKFGKSYDQLTPHERIQVGGTKGGMTTKVGGGRPMPHVLLVPTNLLGVHCIACSCMHACILHMWQCMHTVNACMYACMRMSHTLGVAGVISHASRDHDAVPSAPHQW